MSSPLVATLLLACAFTSPAVAQAPDTTRALGEVIVGGAETREPGVDRVPVAGVLTRHPIAVADVARLIPSATAPVNSRGEALLYVRGAGERQTAVLLDGAPLTVPWDRRLDLGLVPAGVVGSIDVVRGPASLAWGPNATGGAIDLVPRALARDGQLTEVDASGGLPLRGRLGATHLARRRAWSLTVSADAALRTGAALAAPLPFSQDPDALRTNTDGQSAAALVRAEHRGPRARLALTALHVSAAQGVAPEGHLDPTRDRVRFWRIPTWRQSVLVARTETASTLGRLDATAWGALARQTVDAFDDARYASPTETQEDRDASVGARVTAGTRAGPTTLRVIATGLLSAHNRDEGETTDAYRASEWRLGLEGDASVGPVEALVGVGIDGFAPLATSGRASSGAFHAPAVTARLAAPIGGLRAHLGLAHAARFPTMRELFGDALGRFLLNPALRPESTWQAEIGAAGGRRVETRAVAFLRLTDGTIEQDVLADGRRQRINLGGSRAVGVEAALTTRRGPLRLDASGTALSVRGWWPGGASERLPERPSAVGRLAAAWLPSTGWTVAAEAVATGPAISQGPGGPIRLPPSLAVGARIGRRWRVGDGLLGVFARLDNAFDAVVLPQAGLPAPGREARVGVRWIG